jgi:hypothetical protein
MASLYDEITCECEFEVTEEKNEYIFFRLKGEEAKEYIRKCMWIFSETCLKNSLTFKVVPVPAIDKNVKIYEGGNTVGKLPIRGKGKVTFKGILKSSTLLFVVSKLVMGENPDEKAVDESSKCIACTVNKKIILFSCKHLCVCFECSQKIDSCPVCRKPVEECTRVYW